MDLKANAQKCHLLASTNNDVSVKVCNSVIQNSDQQTLLGVTLDKRLSFVIHVKNLCDQAGKKLSVLSTVAPYMNISKRKIIMISFVAYQFNYCPLCLDVAQ